MDDKKRAHHGEPLAFIRRLIAEPPVDDCIKWPFGRMGEDGGGKVRVDGRAKRIGVYLCEEMHGERPSKRHLAVSTCGHSIDLPCCNPRHYRWGTWLDLDPIRVMVGTANRGEKNGRAVLTDEQAILIRELCGQFYDQELGDAFGVSRTTIRRIRTGSHWRHLFGTDMAIRARRFHNSAPPPSSVV